MWEGGGVGPLIRYVGRKSIELYIPAVLRQRNKMLHESYTPFFSKVSFSGSKEIGDHFTGDPWINL